MLRADSQTYKSGGLTKNVLIQAITCSYSLPTFAQNEQHYPTKTGVQPLLLSPGNCNKQTFPTRRGFQPQNPPLDPPQKSLTT